MTTLTPPSHAFIAASRGLYEQLARLDQQLSADPTSLDLESVAAKLARAAHRHTRHLGAAERLPDRLVRSELMFAPARNLPPREETVNARVHGRLTAVQDTDATRLLNAWAEGVTAAHMATKSVDEIAIERGKQHQQATIEARAIGIS